METLKTFNSNGAKIIAIAFISSLLWSSYLFAQGPVKYPSTNGSKMSANEILELGGALQVDVLLIPDTSGVGHGNPPKYYLLLADVQGKFYRGPERRLPGGKPAGVGGGNPNAGACTGALIWQNTGDDIYKCPPTGNTGFGNLEPKKKVHITSVHTTGCLACESHQGMRLEDILNDLLGNQLSSVAWDIEPVASSGNLQIRTPGNSIPVITFTEDGNVGIGTTSPVSKLGINGNISFTNNADREIYIQNTEIARNLTIRPSDVNGGLGIGGDLILRGGNEGGDGGIGGDVIIRGGNGDFGPGDVFIYGGLGLGNGNVILAHTGTNSRGRVGIGTANPAFKLDVAGTVRACTLRVNLTGGGCDYVFEEGYKKDELSFVKDYTEKYHHLPGVQSAKEMIKGGLNVSNMFTTLLKKIEEIFLHLFDLDNAIKGLTNIVDDLINNDKAMEKKIDKLEKENVTLNEKVDMLVKRIVALEENKTRNKRRTH